MEQEIWKDVIGFEGIYRVSNLGRIKSISRVMNNGIRKPQDRILKTCLGSRGYLLAHLRRGYQSHTPLVHRLVLAAFVGPSDLQCNHKNGIKTDNRLENLEWVTCAENNAHAIKTGLMDFRGERHPRSKLTNAQTDQIRRLLAFGVKGRAIAAQFGVTPNTISCIKLGKLRAPRA